MANSINTNIAAYYAQANISVASALAASSVSRLSSGNRIVLASDDAAALSIGTSLLTQVSALRTAQTNAAQGTSLLQVADGALAQIQNILQQQKSLALQAGSGSLTDTDRGFLNQQFQALSAQIDVLTSSTTFNGVKLVDGSLSGANPIRSADDTTTATIDGFTAQTYLTALAFSATTGTLGDTTFYGDLSKGVFDVVFDGTDAYTIGFNLNGSNYVGYIADIDTVTGSTFTLTNGEGTLTFTTDTATDITPAYAKSVAGALAFEEALTAAVAGATAFANRTIRTTDATSGGDTLEGTGITTTDTNATLLDGIDGGDVTIKSQYWNGVQAPTISDFRAVGTYGIGTKFSVTVNGRTYTTGALTDATDLAGRGGAGAIITGAGNNTLKFFLDGDSTNNDDEFISIDVGGGSDSIIDVDNQEGVDRFLSVLNDVFGRSGGGLSFQLGTESTDTVGVSIASANTTTIFEGATLSIATQTDASTASATVSSAISLVTAIRANVGALESRFAFASASLQSAVQNQDAARSQLLDTDIATESTAFATQQVKLQAGVSVLAQANQQLQTLLKLIA